IGHKGGTALENSVVCRRDMGVGADNKADTTIEEMTHGLNFRGRLCVEINQNGIGYMPERRIGNGCLNGPERIVDGRHEYAPQGIDDQNPMAIPALYHHGTPSWCTGSVIDGPDKRRLALDIGQRFALIEGVIAQGDNVSAGVAKSLEVVLDEPLAMTGILAIDHDEIELVARDQARQVFSHRVTARAADDIAQKKQSHIGFPKNRPPASVTTASSGMS